MVPFNSISDKIISIIKVEVKIVTNQKTFFQGSPAKILNVCLATRKLKYIVKDITISMRTGNSAHSNFALTDH